jgi:phosphoribosylaminoimidazolecarboxamide formyltransferase/IMP cyclohydrolase
MYGLKVHQAVLASGVRVTGCTVHLVDHEYDHGPIVLQQSVPVLQGDTAEVLQQRVLAVEHSVFPRAARMLCQGRIVLDGSRVTLRAESVPAGKICRALISVSDKRGVVEFARELVSAGVELVSTGGTHKELRQAGLPVRSIESVTGSPEMLGGRVKTLHPRVHGGILYKRDDPEHVAQAAAHDLEAIDLVVVNLYPFAAAAARYPAFAPELIEEIDIGGPSLLRAAAKNHSAVTVVTDPDDYAAVAQEVRAHGEVAEHTRKQLCAKAFSLSAQYDGMIAAALSGGERMFMSLRRVQELRYGENPHQHASLFRVEGAGPAYRQLHGKELSYNNILDAEGCFDLCNEFSQPAAVFFKHVTPCGAALGGTPLEAYKRAWEADPVCAFGGILAVNRPLDLDVAAAIGEIFLEVIIAPEFTPAALEVLQRKKNLRLLLRTGSPTVLPQVRSFGADVLVQALDKTVYRPGEPWTVVTHRAPTEHETRALDFAWRVCKHVRSNAIVVANENQTLGKCRGWIRSRWQG